MIALILVAVGLSFNLNFSSLFQNDAQKELQQLQTKAETARKNDDLECAKEAYSEMIQRILPHDSLNKERVDWMLYIDAHIQLADILLTLGELERGIRLLDALISKAPPEWAYARIHIRKARFLFAQKRTWDAYHLLQEVAHKTPVENWLGEDRSFFHALEFALSEQYELILKKAQCLYMAGFYKDAALLYEKIANAIEEGLYPKAENVLAPKIRLRLAECYYYLAESKRASLWIEGPLLENLDADHELVFLAAKLFALRGEYERALSYFHKYLENSSDISSHPHGCEALYEIAMQNMREGATKEAKAHFTTLRDWIIQEKKNSGVPPLLSKWSKIPEKSERMAELALVQLVKIALLERRYGEAKTLLMSVAKIKNSDPLYGELAFLQGELFLQLDDWHHAVEHFEEALLFPSIKRDEIVKRLITAHLKIAESEAALSKISIERAEILITPFAEKEDFLLLKAAMLLLKKELLHSEKADNELENLAYHPPCELSLEQSHRLLLLFAESQSEREKKALLYQEATSDSYRESAAFSLAWYLYGLFLSEQAVLDPLRVSQAIDALNYASRLSEKNTPLFFEIMEEKSKLALYTPSKKALSDELVRSLSSLPIESSSLSIEEKIERAHLLHLQALLLFTSREPQDLDRALQWLDYNLSLGDFVPIETQGAWSYLRAHLLLQKGEKEKAQAEFQSLGQKIPSSSWTPAALYWAAKSASDAACAQRYYELCYQNYPYSAYAEDAFFSCFAFDDYLAGREEALAHLKTMNSYFADSSYLGISHALLGFHSTNPSEKGALFNAALALLKKSHDPVMSYFYLRVELELARLDFSEVELEKADILLTHCLDKTRHFFDTTQDRRFLSLYDESRLLFAQVLMAKKEEKAAQELLLELIGQVTQGGSKAHGHFAARIWIEEGKLALAHRDALAASCAFKVAEEAAAGFFSQEEYLELWLLQSDAYLGQNKCDLAIRMLSKVINEDVVSQLRLKAMYRRAEIYEQEKRTQLAFRQFEALSKKGGEWAEKAKMRLKAYTEP